MNAEMITLLIQVGLNAALKIYAAATVPDGEIDMDYLRKACTSWDELEVEILGKKKG